METWVSRETVYDGKLVRLDRGTVRLDDGQEAQREIVDHPGGVAVVPVLGDEVILIRQYRVAIGRPMLEIPAGKLESGDTPEHRARVELQEEAGYAPGRLVPIGRMYPSVGFLTEVLHLFLGFDLVATDRAPDWDEDIEVVPTPLSEVRGKLRVHEFEDAKTTIGLYALLAHLDGLG